MSKDLDPGRLGKLAQRVEKTLREGRLFEEPKQLDPASILVAPCNRDGSPPNVPHVHWGLLKSFVENGFDSTRPVAGVCVEFRTSDGKKQLLEHNVRFSTGNPLLPKLDPAKVLYGSLAGSHLNMALRLIKQGAGSPAGDLGALLVGNHNLVDVVQNGHKWWVLREDTPAEAQVEVSLWRNTDNTENNGTHEIEILQNILATSSLMRKQSLADGGDGRVVAADIVARATRRTPSKVILRP